ncbi:3-phosphoshikimate 1-carboxyvinyltransferase [Aequorivita echinoideorum]|uniref:3-phosphoshikimate 1-carboxyvinyltransferase n=1 Tax=Aequorivita echinoideorum TaxID=1549647 RepID=A0ABS5S0B6_9FLAO|nr:3-phosphoshikimate 1-carboxyvinyltransferase [Aequorivita echinoideorum]MBT0606652.1 3-phosphoshikimate 1-carboxyvinyltransferase [Aequorivita echinoideorum]
MNVRLSGDVISEKNATISITGSKSESNRLLILQAQFPQITIENFSESDDSSVLKNALSVETGDVDIHHAGTAMRFLTAYYAIKPGAEIILTGSERMQERPIGTLVSALRNLGADISYIKNEGFPPLKISGKKIEENEITIDAGISSQYISALMLVAPSLQNGLKIFLKGTPTSLPYIEMTLSLLKKVGITGIFSENKIEIFPSEKLKHVNINIESDWSSASYFYSLVALSKNAEITLSNFRENSIQGDSALVSIYESLGVKTTFYASENKIKLSKSKGQLPDSLILNLADTPDLAQTIAVTCFGLGMSCSLSGLKTLKIKETDRLVALQNELQKLGAVVKIDDETLFLESSKKIVAGIAIETYNDHRMAMAFAPLAVKTELIINNAEVVSKSYPDFWKDLAKTGIKCSFEG